MKATFAVVLALTAGIVAIGATGARGAGEATALAWCATDTSSPDCPTDYLALAPQCLLEGHRRCLIEKARDAARADNCALALRLARACQCHDAATREQLDEGAVCAWLRDS